MSQIENITSAIDTIREFFLWNEEIHSIFTGWSTSKWNYTDFSDLDIWIIFQTEDWLNKYQKEISSIFSKLFKCTWFYKWTSTHLFIILENGVQVDLNLITTAQYFSIKKSENSDFILDNKNCFSYSSLSVDIIYSLLLEWFTTLERAISKFQKKDYFSCQRFIDTIRVKSVIPLLNTRFNGFNKNTIEIYPDKITEELRISFMNLYCIPERNSLLTGIKHIYLLLNELSSLHKSDDDYNFSTQKLRISTFLSNLTI